MIGGKGYPLYAMVFDPGDYKIISEMSPIVQFNSFWRGMSPYDLLFKPQNSGLGSDVSHRIRFPPSGSGFHHCKEMELA